MKFTVTMYTQKRVAAAILLLDKAGVIRKKKKPRKYWMKTWLMKRSNEYSHMNLLLELKENYPYVRFAPMSETKSVCCDHTLSHVLPTRCSPVVNIQ